MSEFTAGPWRYEEEFPGSGYVVASRCNIAVAENVWGADVNSIKEANARLIAAAPELLEATKLLLAALHEGHADWIEKATSRGLAAVAKAEGPE